MAPLKVCLLADRPLLKARQVPSDGSMRNSPSSEHAWSEITQSLCARHHNEIDTRPEPQPARQFSLVFSL